MAWNLSGEMVESCSCNFLCPCWFAKPELMVMDQGWCDSAILFRIQRGSSDGVQLGGRTVVAAVDLPGPTMFEGNGTIRLYVDDAASAEQVRELEAIFGGAKGGPMEVMAGLMTKVLPTQRARIDVQEAGDAITATVGAFGQVKSERLKNEAGQAVTLQNAGMADLMGVNSLNLAPSSSQWRDPQMPRRFETKSGGRGSFSWNG